MNKSQPKSETKKPDATAANQPRRNANQKPKLPPEQEPEGHTFSIKVKRATYARLEKLAELSGRSVRSQAAFIVANGVGNPNPLPRVGRIE